MKTYHVIYLEHQKFGAGSVKQKSIRVLGENAPHAIYRAKLKKGDKWQSLVDCYLMERGGAA